MAAEVGLAFLSASLDVLFDRLASPELLNFIQGKKLDQRLLQRFETTLYAVSAVLNDAEQKQIKDPAVKNWLDALKDAVYEADNLLDELSTKAATEKEVSNFFSYLNFKDGVMGSKIEEIINRLEEIAKHKDVLGLQNIAGEKLPRRPQSTPLVVESDVYGRKKDKEAIIEFLLSDDTCDGKIGVIPIVGLGGIGKTTLAQLVYNDDNVKQKFDLRAWVCVSQEFDVSTILKVIMEDITGEAYNKTNLNLLQSDLMKKLKDKKYLIVLDDVWSESYNDWDPLMTLFHHGNEGSKIIVTTRHERVASKVQTIPIHRLDCLSNEDCWLIFVKHASPSKHTISNSFLEEVHGDIIRKCKGLPLAAKILGGLLRSKPSIKSWEMVLKSDIWDSELGNNVIPALRVSYHYLPPHLKRCFVYCSLLPKDFKFMKEELILLWMAEGLLQPMDVNMTLEEVGYECFEDLASRLFFQRSNSSEERYVMHDLIHDLAESLAGVFYCRLEIGGRNNICSKTRHMSYDILSGLCELKISNLEAINNSKGLQTFLPLLNSWLSDVSSSDLTRFLELLSNCKCLRVLSLCKFRPLEVISNSIGELIHLRYLNLSWTALETLPDSLCKLHNLQTLKLRYCTNLIRLPANIQDLVNLRYLDVFGSRLEEMPRGMGELKNLYFLSDFVVGKDKGSKIGELGDLSDLANGLIIWNLQNVNNKEEVSQAQMMYKKDIEKLALHWKTHEVDDSQTEKDILEKLKPHKNLKTILILGYMGTKFSDWLGHHSYHNMTEINLYNCKNCCSLPSLGQLPHLKTLSVARLDMMVIIDDGFYKSSDSSSLATAFPSLEYLLFKNMPAWEEWRLFEKDAFPVLEHLILFCCPKLVGDLPKHLPALKILDISWCEQLASPIPRALLIDTLRISARGEVVLQAGEGPLSVRNLYVNGRVKLEFLKQLCCESLESLKIVDSSLISLSVDIFPNLKHLIIKRCQNLKSVSVSQASLQNWREVFINDCCDLEDIQMEGFVPSNVTPWKVYNCPKLKTLPGHMIITEWTRPMSQREKIRVAVLVSQAAKQFVQSLDEDGNIIREWMHVDRQGVL